MIADLVSWIQSDQEESLEDTMRMVFYGFFIAFLQCASRVMGQAFLWKIKTAGYKISYGLKILLFSKTIRMTTAANKDFSNNEISNIAMNMTGPRFWRAFYFDTINLAWLPF